MGQIMARLIRAGSMFVGLEQKKEGSKGKGILGLGRRRKRIQYLLDSHCLLASPGSVCSSVTEREQRSK